MTNKEAIEILTGCKQYGSSEPEKMRMEYKEAIALAIKALEELRPQGECESCRHRDPEDKKCDCGGQERQGCPFPVSDDYYCKYYEKGGAE